MANSRSALAFRGYANTLSEQKEFAELALKLSYFGIASSQSGLYLYLLSKKNPVQAGLIIREAGLHRADAYRTLRALASQGLVDVELAAPKRYSAVDPQIALTTLLSKTESRVLFLKGLKRDLGPRLRAFQEVSNASDQSLPELQSEGYYKLVSGREGYYTEIRNMVRNSQSEVLRILSALGLKLTFKLGLDKEYQRAVDKGVSVKIIADIHKENLKHAEKLSKILDIRHLDNINARFTVIDRKITIFGHKFDTSTPLRTRQSSEGNYLILSDPKLAEVSCFFFTHLWKISKKY